MYIPLPLIGPSATTEQESRAEQSKKALKHYDDVGKMNMGKGQNEIIEERILNLTGCQEVIAQLHRMQGGREIDTAQALKYAYHALALPSFSGKTQFAFSLSKVLILYFMMDLDKQSRQPVYDNYYSISEFLRKIANEDRMQISFGDIAVPATVLLSDHADKTFKTLGFFMALMKNDSEYRAAHGSGPDTDSQMFRHANRQGFAFFPMSIKDFVTEMKVLGNKFVVFIDEFSGNLWSVFVRNLVRAVEVACVLAGTNTDIANLTGVNSVSRDLISIKKEPQTVSPIVATIPDVWCIVTLKLLGVPETYGQECKSMVPIIVNLCDRQEEKQLLQNFLMFIIGEIPHQRPGIANEFVQRIMSLSETDHAITFQYAVEMLFINLANALPISKPLLRDEPGQLANLFVYKGHCFGFPGADRKVEFLEREGGYMNNHFYTLMHPTESNAGTRDLLPIEAREVIVIYPSNVAGGKLRYGPELDLWVPMTYIDSKESLLILICLGIPLIVATHKLFALDFAITVSQPSVSNSSNPQALYLNGNVMENLATIACIVSSHFDNLVVDPVDNHQWRSLNMTYKGVPGDVFCKNFMRNLLKEHSEIGRAPVKFVFQFDSRLSAALSTLTVPFLYYANSFVLPDNLATALPLQAATPFRIGLVTQANNMDQIDVYFDICPAGEFSHLINNAVQPAEPRINAAWKAKAVIEAKNWATPVHAGEYYKIVEKALSLTGVYVPLHILLCREVSEFTAVKIREIYKLFQDYKNSGNIYVGHIRDAEGTRTITFKSILNGFELPNCKLNFLIIELESLNGPTDISTLKTESDSVRDRREEIDKLVKDLLNISLEPQKAPVAKAPLAITKKRKII